MNFLTAQSVKKFQTKYIGLVNLVEKLKMDHLGKDFKTAVNTFEKVGFHVITREEGMEGFSPYFHPKRIYLYYNEKCQLSNVHYL
jgi:hypothetical protein